MMNSLIPSRAMAFQVFQNEKSHLRMLNCAIPTTRVLCKQIDLPTFSPLEMDLLQMEIHSQLE